MSDRILCVGRAGLRRWWREIKDQASTGPWEIFAAQRVNQLDMRWDWAGVFSRLI
jgi:hypothetical protein